MCDFLTDADASVGNRSVRLIIRCIFLVRGHVQLGCEQLSIGTKDLTFRRMQSRTFVFVVDLFQQNSGGAVLRRLHYLPSLVSVEGGFGTKRAVAVVVSFFLKTSGVVV